MAFGLAGGKEAWTRILEKDVRKINGLETSEKNTNQTNQILILNIIIIIISNNIFLGCLVNVFFFLSFCLLVCDDDLDITLVELKHANQLPTKQFDVFFLVLVSGRIFLCLEPKKQPKLVWLLSIYNQTNRRRNKKKKKKKIKKFNERWNETDREYRIFRLQQNHQIKLITKH